MSKQKNKFERTVRNRSRAIKTRNKVILVAGLAVVAGVSFSVVSGTYAESSKVECKYKNGNPYVMVCDNEGNGRRSANGPVMVTDIVEVTEQPEEKQQPAAVEQPVVEQTPAVAATEEEVAVPVVGDTEAESADPLGENSAWYPETPSYDSVINYEYGTSSTYVASLVHPEVEGLTADDALLIVMIILSCVTIVGSIVVLTGRILRNRVK